MKPKELAKVRQELGLTQQQLADALQVSRNSVARWEIGLHPIPGPVALLIERMRAEKGGKRRKR
jgi:repressor LexA